MHWRIHRTVSIGMHDGWSGGLLNASVSEPVRSQQCSMLCRRCCCWCYCRLFPKTRTVLEPMVTTGCSTVNCGNLAGGTMCLLTTTCRFVATLDSCGERILLTLTNCGFRSSRRHSLGKLDSMLRNKSSPKDSTIIGRCAVGALIIPCPRHVCFFSVKL